MGRGRVSSTTAWLAACATALGLGLAASTGCSNRPPEQSEGSEPSPASVQAPAAELTGDRPVANLGPAVPAAAERQAPAAEPPSLVATPSAAQALPPPQSEPAVPAQPQTPDQLTASVADLPLLPEPEPPATVPPSETPGPPTIATNRLQLRNDLPPERLVDFLKSVDLEMQSVATGRKGLFDVDEANAELVRLSKLKLQAAEQLEERAAAATPQQTTAIRGKLQALSHLAALGDLQAAVQLETYAKQHSQSEHPAVALDSQLVLIGLAMERLQNGSASDADELIELIDQVAASKQPPDVSALMVMGQARAVLQQYGFDQAAQHVRTVIVELFANHPNPEVGAMAIQLVGSPSYAQLNELLRGFERQEPPTVDQWKTAIESLLADSPDGAAVQYLASAALQFEAFGNDELADATFQILTSSDRFGAAEREEIAVAAEARRARREIVGKPFDFDLPSVDGRPLSITSYAGKVVLMPFWAVAFPDSLRVLQTLDQIRAQSPEQVEIVGVNLDPADAPADEFLRQSPVQFRSFESVTPPGGEANKIAAQFGVASLPFVAVIAPDGTVAAINLTGQGLEGQVQKLLAKE